MNRTQTLSLYITIICITGIIQASESPKSVNESSPLVTFNECLNTATTYTPDPDYQKSTRENILAIEENKGQNLSEMSYSETIDLFKKGLNQSSRNKRQWATVRSKRTSDYPFLLQQQAEIKSLKNEINFNKKITNLLIFGLAVTTATSLYFAYNCNSGKK